MCTFDNPEILADICRVAAVRCRSDADMYRRLAAMPPVEGYEGPLGDDAARLAGEFEARARQALEYAEVFERAPPFAVTYGPGRERG